MSREATGLAVQEVRAMLAEDVDLELAARDQLVADHVDGLDPGLDRLPLRVGGESLLQAQTVGFAGKKASVAVLVEDVVVAEARHVVLEQ